MHIFMGCPLGYPPIFGLSQDIFSEIKQNDEFSNQSDYLFCQRVPPSI